MVSSLESQGNHLATNRFSCVRGVPSRQAGRTYRRILPQVFKNGKEDRRPRYPCGIQGRAIPPSGWEPGVPWLVGMNWNFWALNITLAFAFLGFTVWAFRRLPLIYALYTAVMVLLPLSANLFLNDTIPLVV